MPPGPGIQAPAKLPASEHVLGGRFVALLHLGAVLAPVDGSTVVAALVSVSAVLRIAVGGCLTGAPPLDSGMPVPAKPPASERPLGGRFVAPLYMGVSFALINGSTVVAALVSVAAALHIAAAGRFTGAQPATWPNGCHPAPAHHPAPGCHRQAKPPASGHRHPAPRGARERP
ncbi:hypothetical protein ACWEQC_19970 [Streptomyces shenzhenensis]